MNPFKVAFVILGVIYLGLLTWAIGAHLTGSIAVSVFGILLCSGGWKISDNYFE
jgi:hypothetical protein